MKNKYIFLDIDGPLIGTPQHFMHPYAAMHRSHMNSNGIGILKYLCHKSGSKIVTNSSHNYHYTNGEKNDLKTDLIRHGIPEDSFHTEWRTGFPFEGDTRPLSWEPRTHPRMFAIEQWLTKNDPDADWVVIDDLKFTDDPRLILVDFDYGIDWMTFTKISTMWNLGNTNFLV